MSAAPSPNPPSQLVLMFIMTPQPDFSDAE
jgi:hypothetical protein